LYAETYSLLMMRNCYGIVETAFISVLLKRVLLYMQWHLGILLFIEAVQHTQLSVVLFHTVSHISSAFEVLSFTNLQSLSIPCTIPHYPLTSTWNIGKYQSQNNIKNLHCVYPICVTCCSHIRCVGLQMQSNIIER
jgi:hypothetical protein